MLHFHSTLIVAMPEYCQDREYRIIPPFTSQNEQMTDKVDIVLLNCQTKEKIVPFLKTCIEKWKKSPQTNRTKHIVKDMSGLMKVIRDETYKYEVPDGILSKIRSLSKIDIKKEKMYYCSSVRES